MRKNTRKNYEKRLRLRDDLFSANIKFWRSLYFFGALV